MIQSIDNRVIPLFSNQAFRVHASKVNASRSSAGSVENGLAEPTGVAATLSLDFQPTAAISRELQVGNDGMAILQTAEAATVKIVGMLENMDRVASESVGGRAWSEIAERIDRWVTDSGYLGQNLLNADGPRSKQIVLDAAAVSEWSDRLLTELPEDSSGSILTVAVSDNAGVVRTEEWMFAPENGIEDFVHWLNGVFGEQLKATWRPDQGFVAEDVKNGASDLEIKMFKGMEKIARFRTVREGSAGAVILGTDAFGAPISFKTVDLTAKGLAVEDKEGGFMISEEKRNDALGMARNTLSRIRESMSGLEKRLLEATDRLERSFEGTGGVPDFQTALGRLRFEKKRTVSEESSLSRQCHEIAGGRRALDLLSGTKGSGTA